MPLNTTAHVYFSPSGGATAAIEAEIGRARSEVLVQAYSFTSKLIAESLIKAKKNAVNVVIILDKSNLSDSFNEGTVTAGAGIPTFIDSHHNIAHNKVMIIDRETVITGSFNFTRSAEIDNAENILIIRSKELANLYIANWNAHRQHSEPYGVQHHKDKPKRTREYQNIDRNSINRIFRD